MASRQDKIQMKDYFARLLDASGISVLSQNDDYIDARQGEMDVRLILAHSKAMKSKDYFALARDSNFYMPVLRKGDFHKLLNDVRGSNTPSGKVKGSLEALQEYTADERARILSLQGLEKEVLLDMKENGVKKPTVAFYFPFRINEGKLDEDFELSLKDVVPASIREYDPDTGRYVGLKDSSAWGFTTRKEKPNQFALRFFRQAGNILGAEYVDVQQALPVPELMHKN